ncbi:ribonucleotide-diphosphate reductase subunit rnr1, partial [Ascosphaera pollenicola]
MDPNKPPSQSNSPDQQGFPIPTPTEEERLQQLQQWNQEEQQRQLFLAQHQQATLQAQEFAALEQLSQWHAQQNLLQQQMPQQPFQQQQILQQQIPQQQIPQQPFSQQQARIQQVRQQLLRQQQLRHQQNQQQQLQQQQIQQQQIQQQQLQQQQIQQQQIQQQPISQQPIQQQRVFQQPFQQQQMPHRSVQQQQSPQQPFQQQQTSQHPAAQQQVPQQLALQQMMPQQPVQQPRMPPALPQQPIDPPPAVPAQQPKTPQQFESPHPAPPGIQYQEDYTEDGLSRVSRVLRVQTAHKPKILQQKAILTPPATKVKIAKDAAIKARQASDTANKVNDIAVDAQREAEKKRAEIPRLVRIAQRAAADAANVAAAKLATAEGTPPSRPLHETIPGFPKPPQTEIPPTNVAPSGSAIQAQVPVTNTQFPTNVTSLSDGAKVPDDEQDATQNAIQSCADAAANVMRTVPGQNPPPMVGQPVVTPQKRKRATSVEAFDQMDLDPEPSEKDTISISVTMTETETDTESKQDAEPEGHTVIVPGTAPVVAPVQPGAAASDPMIIDAQSHGAAAKGAAKVVPPPIPVWKNEMQNKKRIGVDYTETLDALHTSGAKSVYINDMGQIQKISPQSTDDGKTEVFGGEGRYFPEHPRELKKPQETKATLNQEPTDLEKLTGVTGDGEIIDISDSRNINRYKDQDPFKARCLVASEKCAKV